MSDCIIAAERHSFLAETTHLSYLEWPGDGPTAVLLHGITSSAATLWRIGAEMAEHGYHVIAIDMPGHGASELSPAHDIDTIAGLISNLIVGLGLHDILLIGHSWGGAVSIALASGKHQGKAALAHIIVLDPLLKIDASWGPQVLPNYTEGLGQPAEVVAPALYAANPDWHVCDVYWKAQAMAACRYAQVEGLFLRSGTWQLVDRLGRIGIPHLILLADPKSTIVSGETSAAIRQQLNPIVGKIAVIPGTKHNLLRGSGYPPTMAQIWGWLG